jgi:c-di-GMP-binding flagellar brake protein YcgR
MNSQFHSADHAERAFEEKRRHSRHRYIERLYIGTEDGTWYNAMTYEISPGGLSDTTTAELVVEERVKLSPIIGQCFRAVVRRKEGAMYGFEFVEMTPKIEEQLRKLCEGLPVFQSLLCVK